MWIQGTTCQLHGPAASHTRTQISWMQHRSGDGEQGIDGDGLLGPSWAGPACRQPGPLQAVVGLVMAISNQHVASATEPYAPSVRTVPVVQNIASGQSLITANGFASYRFQVTPAMRSAHVTGKFSATGGSGNDIAAILATEEEATNWINGHQAKAFYTTPGQETTGTFDVCR